MENFEIVQVKLNPFSYTPRFKKSQVKLIPCKHFPEFLEKGIFLVASDSNQVLKVKEKNESYCILESKDGKLIRLEDLEKSKELLMIFLVNGNIDYSDEPDVLFKIADLYTIASPFDLIGDQIEEALIIDVKPHQIGNSIKKYGDYRRWKSNTGLTAHQAYYWVDRIMVLDESKMREDGSNERKYISEHSRKEFESMMESAYWEEIVDSLDFEDVEKILANKEVEIETEIVEFENDTIRLEFPVLRNDKAMICIS